MKIRKAIIPAAGLGTRFLPATKAQPKEMLPIVDKPSIQYIIEEAVEAGIEDILIITGRSKRAIEDHFDYSPELERELEKKGKLDVLENLRKISDMVNIQYIRQKEPRGLGHAVYCAHSFINDEPFAVLLGDDVAVCKQPAIGQLMDVYDAYHASVLGVSTVPEELVSSYGIVAPDPDFKSDMKGLSKVCGLVEKPPLDKAPSRTAIFGRYIITPGIFEVLARTKPGAGGEIQLTDALKELMQTEDMYALDFEGKRYDIGSKIGFLKATVDFALQRDDLKEPFMEFLKEKVKA
ncbi:MAG: UTP--glucose-1-phosphate uridylyltransferase GalU [Clostridiales bacterium]|nr:UTP--glucose-1-phosphate uridylyltransferase GalU [Clostridiales bacterium]